MDNDFDEPCDVDFREPPMHAPTPQKCQRWYMRLRRPQALRWLILLVLAWLIYLLCGAKGFTLPVLGFSALMILLLIDELFFFD